MLDRASSFADDQIIELLKSKFVPVAIDQAYQRRQKDAEGDFYRKIAGQGPRSNFQGTTQGFYVATASGKFLGYSNHRSPERTTKLLNGGLKAFQPERVDAIDAGKADARYNPTPPRDGLIVAVRAKVLGGYPETDNPWQQIFQQAVSRDNLWVTAAEHKALLSGKWTEQLQRRLARFHLVDNTRGEPPMWSDKEIRKLDLRWDDGILTGSVHLETEDGKRGYECQLYGITKSKDGQIIQFDLVALGEFWGSGRYTGNPPPGRFPLAISFTLTDGNDVADGIPPQGSRGWVKGYLQN